MTAPSDLPAVLGTLTALANQLSGRDGNAIREHLQRLGFVLASHCPDAELRAQAASELEQLITVLAGLGALRGAAGKAVRGFPVAKLADGLRAFVAYLRAPTADHQAEVEQLIGELRAAPALQPVPLDQLNIDERVEALAHESARRAGLSGGAAKRAVERMQREIAALVRRLEQEAHQEAARTKTASDFATMLDRVVELDAPVGRALAPERAAILAAFCRVDLRHMADGLNAFALWLADPADDAAAHVAALRAQLADALGPPTAGDPLRSDAERRADFEHQAEVALDAIFRGAGHG